MTEAELRAFAAALGISDTQYAGMTVTSAAQFLEACSRAKQVGFEARLAAYTEELTRLQIACERAELTVKNIPVNVPPAAV